MTADDLDKHQFAQLGEDGFATGPPAATLCHCEAEEVDYPAATVSGFAGAQDGRQRREQRVEGTRIAAKIPANEPGPLISAAAMDQRERQVLVYWPIIHCHVGLASRSRARNS